MPQYPFEVNGRRGFVDAPDPASALDMIRAIREELEADPGPQATPAAPFVDEDERAAAEIAGNIAQPDYPDDGPGMFETLWEGITGTARAAGTGLARGGLELATLPISVQRGVEGLPGFTDNIVEFLLPGEEEIPELARGPEGPSPNEELYAGQDMAREGLDSILYQPEGTWEEMVAGAAEFVPGAMIAGPGGMVSRSVRFGAVPGAASAAAGEMTEGTPIEPAARMAGAALGLGAGALMPRIAGPPNAASVLVPPTLTQADRMAAETLMLSASERGVPLTWPEAVHRATQGRVDVTSAQRIIEQSRTGGPVMSEFMAARPQQTAAAFADEAQNLGPLGNPVTTGLRVQKVSGDAINALRTRINGLTEHLYGAAGPQRLDVMRFSNLESDPLFQRALREVRNDPVHSRAIRDLPNDSVGVLNEVKKWLDRQASTYGNAGDMQGAGVYGEFARQVRDEAGDVSPEYAEALRRQEEMRRTILGPAEASALGQMSRTPDLRAQVDTLFPAEPMPNSQGHVRRVVQSLAEQDPRAAQALVRTYLEREFQSATQQLRSGPNQWGAADFASAVAGHSQGALNLETAITQAFPDGHIRWQAFRDLLDVFEATGRRQRPGSATAQNTQMNRDMASGGRVVEAARNVSNPLTAFDRWMGDMMLSRNGAALARIITDPNAGALLRQLVAAPNIFEKTRVAGLIAHELNTASVPPGGQEAFASQPLPLMPAGR